MFEVVLSPEARVIYAAADRPLARKLANCFTQLEHDPRRHPNIKRLAGKLSGCSRYRVGDWRVIYRIKDQTRQVWILDIAHRRDVYE